MPILRFMGEGDNKVIVDAYDKKIPMTVMEYTVASDAGPYLGTFYVEEETGKKGMKVHVLYDGCWSFAPGMGDEDVPLPEWQMRTFTDPNIHRYSTIFALDVPDGTRVRWIGLLNWTRPQEKED